MTAVQKVLTNRGILLKDIEHYLHTTNEDILDPCLVENIEAGAKLLVSHIARESKVQIQVDSDFDGFASAAILINYLNCLFPAFVQNNISYRIHTGKQHGIIPETLNKDISLVIAPDSSSNDYEAHEYLSKNGIDVLVIDHHEAEKVSEYACVINNQLCDYPTKSLSGAGMVYKLCQYIDKIMGAEYAPQFLDLVATALVADMMDLKDFETRHLVTLGLKQIRNPYLKGMVNKQSFQLREGITPFGIAFYIAPYVNATIRVGTQEEKLILFESMLDYRGYEQIPSTKRGCKGQVETRVEQACRNCMNIKNRQTKARDDSLEKIERIIESQNLLENKLLVIRLDEGQITDKSLTGLIANELMSRYQRPVLLLNRVVNEMTILDDNGKPKAIQKITWEGSGRGYGKSKLTNFKDFLIGTNLVMYAEGHQNALGVGIEDENIDKFIYFTNEALKNFDFSPAYDVDLIYQYGDMKPADIIELAELKSIWGQGVEEPKIAVENIKVNKSNLNLMSADKNPTLKITLPDGTSLIKFKSCKEEYEKLYSDLGCVTINIVGTCERNVWNGMINPQIIITDYEVVDTQQYYF